MNAQLTLFDKPKTIKEKTLEALRNEYLSTTQLIYRVGASSADRRRRDLEAEGYNIQTRTREDGITLYHIE